MFLDAPAELGSGFPSRSTSAGRRRAPVGFLAPLALFLISMSLIVAAWGWLAAPVSLDYAAVDPARKLDCVSYAPFRDGQTPWNSDIIISPEQIAEDLGQLARISGCIRTYSIENGLDRVPELAATAGLKVILGIWLGRDRTKNAALMETAVALSKAYPGVVTSVMVGSEVLLRGEMTVSDLRAAIRSVKARVTVPVSYADAWEFWLRYRELGDDVDFVTIHILPYWEDIPVPAEDAAAHVIDIHRQVALALPGKEILIGEAGWPSRGRMRDGALPSRVNQARFFSELLGWAGRENFRLNLFEAYDESWKRQWEGTVGAHWGLLDGDSRQLKYAFGSAVSNYPFWKPQLAAGLAFGSLVFAVALLTLWRRRSQTGWARWLAVAASATTGGILLGLGAEKAFYESYGFAGWLNQGLLLAAAIVAAAFVRQRADGRASAAGHSGTGRPARGQNPIGRCSGAGLRAHGHHAGRRGDRARSGVRPAFTRFPVCRPDHGGGADLDRHPAQLPKIGHSRRHRSGVCGPVRGCRALCLSQRGGRQLAIAMDCGGVFPVWRRVVAAAFRYCPERVVRSVGRIPWGAAQG